MAKKRSRPAVNRTIVHHIVAETGRTMWEWHRLMDECGRRGLQSQQNVSWLKKNFGLPQTYAATIQRGYKSDEKLKIWKQRSRKSR